MPTIIQAQAKLIRQKIYPPLQKRICHCLLIGLMGLSFVLLLVMQNISMASSTYPNALLVTENTTDANHNLQYLQEKAEQGAAKAQYELVAMFYFGDGVPQYFKKVLSYYELAGRAKSNTRGEER